MKLQPRCTLSQQDKGWRPDFGGSQFRLVYSPSQHGDAVPQQQVSTAPWGSYLGLSSPRAAGNEALFLVTDAAGGVVCSCSSPGLPGSKGYENSSVSWHLQAQTGQRAWCSPAGHSIFLDAGRNLLLFTPAGVHTLQLATAGEATTSEAAAGAAAMEQAHLADAGFALVAISSSSTAGRQLHLWTAPAEGSPAGGPGLWRQLPLWPHAAPTATAPASTSTVSDMEASAAAGGVSCFAVAFPRSDMSGQWLACAALEAASPGEVWVSVLQQPLLSALPPSQLLQPGGLLVQDPLLTGGCGGDQPWSWQSLALVLPGHSLPTADKFELEGPTMGSLQLSAAADQEQAVEVQSCVMTWNPSGTKLAVGVSASSDRAWLLVFASGMQDVHEYCWEDAPDTRPTGLLHPGPRALSSLCWLAEGGLAVMDTWGQLKVLGAGATLEQLQLIDLSGMTITFRPTVQLSYSMLLAACSSSAAIRPSFDRRFLLCGIPPPAPDQPSQLAVWDGSSLLVVNLLPGVDPSQHVIDQTINARAHLLHGDTKRRLAHQKEQERLQALRYSVVQRLPEGPGEEGPAAAGLLSCAAGPSVLQVLLEAPDAEADATGSLAPVSTSAPMQQMLPVPVLANPLTTAPPAAEQPLQMATGSSCCEGVDTAAAGGSFTSSSLLQQEQGLFSTGASRQVSATSNLPPTRTGLMSTSSAAEAVEQGMDGVGTTGIDEQEQAAAADHSQLWQLLQTGDQAFIAGQWAGAAAAYQQAWPLSAGHVMALQICQYDLPGALATVQRAVAEALAAVEQQEDPLEAATAEQVAVSGAAAVVLAPLFGLLCGAVCQLLMTCISSFQVQPQVGGSGQPPPGQPSGLCLTGSPLYWSLQLAALLQPEELVDLSWAPGQYVQLLPAALITSAAQLAAAAAPGGCAAAGGAVAAAAADGSPCLGDLPARAAGYAVLAAAWGGGSMELLPFAASAALHLQDAWGNGNWRAAAVLADGCSRMLREMLAGDVTEEEQLAQNTWDDAARCCLLWRLVDHTGAPLPLLADTAVQVVAAAQQLWSNEQEGCARVKQQVAAHLWRCACLRLACSPILAPPPAVQRQEEVLAADAASSQASIQQQLLEALANTVQQHQQQQEEGVTCVRARKGAAVGVESVLKLLQLLLWYRGSPLTVEDVLEQASQYSKGILGLQERLGSALARSGLVHHAQWQQACQAAAAAGNSAALGQTQLAELALQVDMVCLMRALLQVAADGCLEQQLGTSMDSIHNSKVLEMPGLEVWPEQQELQRQQPAHTAAGAVERVAQMCWLLECREQASQLLAAGGGRASAANCAAAAVMLSMDGLHPQQALQHAVLQALLRSPAAVPQEVVQSVAASCAAVAEAGANKTAALLRQLEEACAVSEGDVQALDADGFFIDYVQHVQQQLVPGAAQEEASFLQQVLSAALSAQPLQSACGPLPPLSSCFIHPLCTSTTAAAAAQGVTAEHAARLAICAAMVHPASAAAATASDEGDAGTLTAQALAWQQQQVDLVLDQAPQDLLEVTAQPDAAGAATVEGGSSSPTQWALEDFLQPAASQVCIGELLHEDLSAVEAAPSSPPAAAASPAPAAAAAAAYEPTQPSQVAEQESSVAEVRLPGQSRLSARPPPLHLGASMSPSRLGGSAAAAAGLLRAPSGVSGVDGELPRPPSALLREGSGVSGFYGLYSAPNSPKSPRKSPVWAPAATAAALAAGGLSGLAATMPGTPHTPSRLTRLAPNLDAQQQRLLHGLPEHLWEGPGAPGGADMGMAAGEAPMTPRRSGLRLQPLVRNFSVSSRPQAAVAAGQEVPATPGGRVSRAPSLEPAASGMTSLLAALRRRTSMAGDTDLQRLLPAPQYSLQLLQESSQQLVNQQRNSLGSTFQALLPEELRLPVQGGTGGSLEFRRRSTAGSTGGEGRASLPGSMRSTTEGDQLLVGRRYVSSIGSRSIGGGSTRTSAAGVLLAVPSTSSATSPAGAPATGNGAPAATAPAAAASASAQTPPAEAAVTASPAAGQPMPGKAASHAQLQLQQDSSRHPQQQQQLQQQPSSRRASSTRHTLAAASFHQELQPHEGLQVLLVPELGSQQKARRVSQEQWAQGVPSLRHLTSSSRGTSGRPTAEQVTAAGGGTPERPTSEQVTAAGGGEQGGPSSSGALEAGSTTRVPAKAPSGQLTRQQQAPSPTRSNSRQHSTLYSSTYQARELSRRKLAVAAAPAGTRPAGDAPEAPEGGQQVAADKQDSHALPARPPGQPLGEGVMQDYMPLLGSAGMDSSNAVLATAQAPPPPRAAAAAPAGAKVVAPDAKPPSLRQRMLRGFRSWAQRKQARKQGHSTSTTGLRLQLQQQQQQGSAWQGHQDISVSQLRLDTPAQGQPLGEGVEAPPSSPMSARLAALAAQQLEEQRAREQQQLQQRKEAVRDSSSYQSIPQLMGIVRKLFSGPEGAALDKTVNAGTAQAAAAYRSPAGRVTADQRFIAGAVKPPAVSVTWADQLPAAAAGSLMGRLAPASPPLAARTASPLAAAAADDPLAEYLGCFSPTATSRAVSRQVSGRALSASPSNELAAATRRSSSVSPSRASSSRLLGGGGGGGGGARLSGLHRGLAADAATAAGLSGPVDAARGSLVQAGTLPDVGQYWNDAGVFSVDGSVQPSRAGSFKQRTVQQQVVEQQQQQRRTLVGPTAAAASAEDHEADMMLDFFSTSRSGCGDTMAASMRAPLNPMRPGAQQQQQQQGLEAAAGAQPGAALYGQAAAMQQSLAGDVKDFFSTSRSGVGRGLLSSQLLPGNPLLVGQGTGMQQQQQQQDEEEEQEALMRQFLATSKPGTCANLLASQAVPTNPMLGRQLPPQAAMQQQQQQQQQTMATAVRDFFATSRSGMGPDLLASQQVPHNPLRMRQGSPPPPPLQLAVSPPQLAAGSSLPPPSPTSPAAAGSSAPAPGVQAEFLVTTWQGSNATPEALLVSQAVPLNPLRRSLKARSPPTIIAGPPPLGPEAAGEGEDDAEGDAQQQQGQSSSCPGTPTSGSGEFSPLKQRAASFGSHKKMLLHGPSRLSWRSSPHSTSPEPAAAAAAGGGGSPGAVARLSSPLSSPRGSVKSPGPSSPQQQLQQQMPPWAGAAILQPQEQHTGYQRQTSGLSSASSGSAHQGQAGSGFGMPRTQQQQQQASRTPTPANSQRQLAPAPYQEGLAEPSAGAGGVSQPPRSSVQSTPPPPGRQQLQQHLQQAAGSPGGDNNWSGLATSMQRIAHCLEEFLVTRSPSGSPYATTGGAATGSLASSLHPAAAALLSSPASPAAAAAALLSSGMWVNPFWVPGDAAGGLSPAAAAAMAGGMPVPGLAGTVPMQLKSFFRGGVTAAASRRTAGAAAAAAAGAGGAWQEGAAYEDEAAEEGEPGLVGEGIRAEGELIMGDPEYLPSNGEDAGAWGDGGDQSRYQTAQGGWEAAAAAADEDGSQDQEEQEADQDEYGYEYDDAGTSQLGYTVGRATGSRMLGTSAGGASEAWEEPEQLPRGLQQAQQLLTQRQTLGRQQQQLERSTQQRSTQQRSTQQRSTQQRGTQQRSTQQRSTQQRGTQRRGAGRRTVGWADTYSGGGAVAADDAQDDAQDEAATYVGEEEEEADGEEEGGMMDEEQQQRMAYLTIAAEAAGVPVQRLTAGLSTSGRANQTRGGAVRSVRFTQASGHPQDSSATQRLADWEESEAAAAAEGGYAVETLRAELEEEEEQLLYATGLHVTATRTLGHPQQRTTHQPGVYSTRRTGLRATGPAGLAGAAALPGLNTRLHTGGHLRLLRGTRTTGTLRHISTQQARPGNTSTTHPDAAVSATGTASAAAAQDLGEGDAPPGMQGQGTGVLPAVEVAEYLREPRLLRPGSRAVAATAATAKKVLFASLQQQQQTGSSGTFGRQLRTLDVSSHLDQGVMSSHLPDSPSTQRGLTRASAGPASGSVIGHLWHPPNSLAHSSPAVQTWVKGELMEQLEGTTLRGATAANTTATIPRPTRLLGGDCAGESGGTSSRLMGGAATTDSSISATQPQQAQQQQQQQEDSYQGYQHSLAEQQQQHVYMADPPPTEHAPPAAATGGGASHLSRVTGAPAGTIEILPHSPHQGATAALGNTLHSSYVPGGPAFWDELQEDGVRGGGGGGLNGTTTTATRRVVASTTAAAAAARAAAAAEARAAAQHTLAGRLLATGGRNGSSMLHSLAAEHHLSQQQFGTTRAAGEAGDGMAGGGTAASDPGRSSGVGVGKRTVLVAVSPRHAATAAAAARRRRGRLQQLAQRGRGLSGQQQQQQEEEEGEAGSPTGEDTASRLLQAAGQLATGLPEAPGSPLTLAALEVVRGTDALLRTWQGQHHTSHAQQQEQQRSGVPVTEERWKALADGADSGQRLADSISFAELPRLPAAGHQLQHQASSRSNTAPQQQPRPAAHGPGVELAVDAAAAAEPPAPARVQMPPGAGAAAGGMPQDVAASTPPTAAAAAAASLVPVELLVQALGALQEQQRSMALALSATAAAAAAAAANGSGGAASGAHSAGRSHATAASTAGAEHDNVGWEGVYEGVSTGNEHAGGYEEVEGDGEVPHRWLQGAQQQHLGEAQPHQGTPGGDHMAMLLGATAAAAVLTRQAAGGQSSTPQQQQQQVGQVSEVASDSEQTAAELAELILSAFQREGGLIEAGQLAGPPSSENLQLQEGQLIGPDALGYPQQPSAAAAGGASHHRVGTRAAAPPPAAAAGAGSGPSVVQVMDVSDLCTAPAGFLAGAATSAWPPGRPNGWVKAVGQGQHTTTTHSSSSSRGPSEGGWYGQLGTQQPAASTSTAHGHGRQRRQQPASTAGRLQQQQQGLKSGGGKATQRTSALRRSGQQLGIPCVYSGCQHHMQPSGQLTMVGQLEEGEEEAYGAEQLQGTGSYQGGGWGAAGLPVGEGSAAYHTWQQQQQQQQADEEEGGPGQHQQRWEDAMGALQAAGLPLGPSSEQNLASRHLQQQQQWKGRAAQDGQSWAGAGGGGPVGVLQQQQQPAAADVENGQFEAERESLRQALARAEAARSTARATARVRAQQQAARIKAELGDLCSMLKDVDRLAAVMQEESAAVAAELEEQERKSSGGGGIGGAVGGRWELAAAGGVGREVDGW